MERITATGLATSRQAIDKKAFMIAPDPIFPTAIYRGNRPLPGYNA
jgi:hypothetical protein